MRRHQDKQETVKANQVEVIQVTGLVEQKDVSEADKKEKGRHPIGNAGRHRRGQQTQQNKMHLHAKTRPGMHPAKSVIFEIKIRDDEITMDASVLKIAEDFPQQD